MLLLAVLLLAAAAAYVLRLEAWYIAGVQGPDTLRAVPRSDSDDELRKTRFAKSAILRAI